eukprot:6586328-Prymnesium_polylepis.1
MHIGDGDGAPLQRLSPQLAQLARAAGCRLLKNTAWPGSTARPRPCVGDSSEGARWNLFGAAHDDHHDDHSVVRAPHRRSSVESPTGRDTLMEPAVASLLGSLVQELSLAVYTAETSEQATALLSSQLELLRLQQVKQEPTETLLPAAKVPRLGAAGVELLDAEAGPGGVRYESQRETRFRLVVQ